MGDFRSKGAKNVIENLLPDGAFSSSLLIPKVLPWAMSLLGLQPVVRTNAEIILKIRETTKKPLPLWEGLYLL